MSRKQREPGDPDVVEGVLQRIRSMTREDWLREVAWRPDGVEETWRLQDQNPVDEPGAPSSGSNGSAEPQTVPLAARSVADQ